MTKQGVKIVVRGGRLAVLNHGWDTNGGIYLSEEGAAIEDAAAELVYQLCIIAGIPMLSGVMETAAYLTGTNAILKEMDSGGWAVCSFGPGRDDMLQYYDDFAAAFARWQELQEVDDET